jgi:serine/threonine protein kinase
LFKLTLFPSVRSPYKTISSNYPDKEVKEILLKFVFINPDKNFVIRDTNGDQLVFLNTTSEEEFYREVAMQDKIFKGSLNRYLEPICPNILFSGQYVKSDIIEVLTSLKNTDNDELTSRFLTAISLADAIFDIGIIVMEYLSGFMKLSEYIELYPDKQSIARRMAQYEIARLGQLDLIHGDLNMGNILINPDYYYYDFTLVIGGKDLFQDRDLFQGRAMLIDFGSTFDPSEVGKPLHITPDNLYSATIQSLLVTSYKYPKDTAFTFTSFQWLKSDDFEFANKMLKVLYERRMSARQKFDEHVQKTSDPSTSVTATGKNPFNILDPGNILTEDFIGRILERFESRGGSKKRKRRFGSTFSKGRKRRFGSTFSKGRKSRKRRFGS